MINVSHNNVSTKVSGFLLQLLQLKSLCKKNSLCVKCLGETTLQQFKNGIGWGGGVERTV